VSAPGGRPRLRVPQLWTGRQRRAIVILLACALIYLTIRLIRNPVYVSDPQPRDPPRALELADKIDPNTADVATLAALPMIGQRRAQDIVDYRERYVAQNPGKLPFTRVEDLVRIKGFGSAMIEHVRPYLTFPRQSPTTQR
jgi:competence ComEA-like helix-hairpin-helix protein